MSRTSSWPGGCRPAEAAWTLVPCRPASAPVVWGGSEPDGAAACKSLNCPKRVSVALVVRKLTPRERLRASRRRAKRAGLVLEQLRDPVRSGRSVPYELFHEGAAPAESGRHHCPDQV